MTRPIDMIPERELQGYILLRFTPQERLRDLKTNRAGLRPAQNDSLKLSRNAAPMPTRGLVNAASAAGLSARTILATLLTRP